MSISDQNGSSEPLSGAEKKLRNLKKFGPGFDPRRNLKGRPRSFDQLREFAQEVAHREIPTGKGKHITIAEAILLKLAGSKEPQALKTFLEFAFGRVPEKLDLTTEHKTKLFLNYSHEESNVREDHSRLSPSVSPGAN